MDLHFYCLHVAPAQMSPFEYVERKGLGHPDSICDAVMESAAEALRGEYLQRCGRVLHHNLDKALLVAGQTVPKLGGGRVVDPIQIIAGDRAIGQWGDTRIPVDEIVEAAVRDWFRENLRFVDADTHLSFQSEIKPGSSELVGIFDRETPVANDTSAAVGYAPLSETEQLVLATEHYINSPGFKERFPSAGEDVKVMAVRIQQRLRMTIAVAMVDRFIHREADYFDQKQMIREEIQQFVQARCQEIGEVTIEVNTLDDRGKGTDGMYLTVNGTSAENGDGGEVGRGNAVNGLISLNRPSGSEAASGKNTVCHVGNIYSHLSQRIANDLVDLIDPVNEATVWLCSQIGQPIDQPSSTSVRVSLVPGVDEEDVADTIANLIAGHLSRLAAK